MLHIERNEEQELFSKVAEGDKSAFRQLFDTYHKKLSVFVFRLTKSESDTSEIVQDIFVKLWVGRAHLADVNNPHAYVFAMASNRTMDHLRKLSSEAKMLKNLWRRIYDRQELTEESYDAKECDHLIRQAVNQLSPQKQKIFRLSRNEGLKHEEIAALLNLSKSTVKNHLVEILRHIKAYLHHHSESLLLIAGLIHAISDEIK